MNIIKFYLMVGYVENINKMVDKMTKKYYYIICVYIL